MVTCDKSIERKNLRKVVNRKKGVKREKIGGGEDRGVKFFYSMRVASTMHMRTTAALECLHLPLQVRS